MQLAWTSDLHLVFLRPSATGAGGLLSWLEGLAREPFDALAISGDISEAPSLREHLGLLESYVRRPIYFVLGNHDFYRGSFEQVVRPCGTSPSGRRFSTASTFSTSWS